MIMGEVLIERFGHLRVGQVEVLLHTAYEESKCLLAVLVDPDTFTVEWLERFLGRGGERVDLWFVGGSVTASGRMPAECIRHIRRYSSKPVVLFPGNPVQLCGEADAVLFLSLVSGRNPEFLIGHHVVAAPLVERLGIEAIPTAYLLVGNGVGTTAHYVSHSFPLPSHKPELAAATALAASLLGMRVVFVDRGSGAEEPVSPAVVEAVAQRVHLPLIVGGGIRRAEQLEAVYRAGATVAVVGTALEEQPELVGELVAVKESVAATVHAK